MNQRVAFGDRHVAALLAMTGKACLNAIAVPPWLLLYSVIASPGLSGARVAHAHPCAPRHSAVLAGAIASMRSSMNQRVAFRDRRVAALLAMTGKACHDAIAVPPWLLLYSVIASPGRIGAWVAHAHPCAPRHSAVLAGAISSIRSSMNQRVAFGDRRIAALLAMTLVSYAARLKSKAAAG